MVKQGYFGSALEADIKFHETLIKSSQNAKLLTIYLASHIPLFYQKLGKSQASVNYYEQTDAEHKVLLDAINKLKHAE